ncbi:hypothetical protein O181_036707 [Austropuccinia psidii MF-1]|uniref:PLD phosphodiesterase domain-containing protein n=1 Tax=Austropuccinia psidii MF-1 TaxID=1389203 RepID=A0A9Q3HA69_9BASI|nr:hypothetical protein [Austropuccinia psidii MF-1]
MSKKFSSSSFVINPNAQTVTSHLSANPHQSPHQATNTLFPKPSILKRIRLRFSIKDDLYHKSEPNQAQLENAFRSGKWNSNQSCLATSSSSSNSNSKRPSQLFLKIFSDVLLCLERNQLSGLVSPPLIASCGVIPLTILSVIPHIIQHYYDCIVLAQHEVLLATNYLQKSDSQRKICDALIELSKRVQQRHQKQKVIVKLIYDRGNWKQIFKNHQKVKPNTSDWREVGLPDPKDIPNLELEVINFHRVLLGTFHSKFLVVDRTVALLNSNNIQDRPNIEMMIHLEGPIVESFYDMFLISWSNHLKPPLPLLNQTENLQNSSPQNYRFGFDNPFLRNIDIVKSAKDARNALNREAEIDRNAIATNQQHDGIMNSSLATVVRDLMDERRRIRHQSEIKIDEPSRLISSPSARLTNVVQFLIEERRRLKTSNSIQPVISSANHIQSSNAKPCSVPILIKKDNHTITLSTLASKVSIESPSTTIIGSSSEAVLALGPLNKMEDNSHPHPSQTSSVPAIALPPCQGHGLKMASVNSRMRALSDTLNAGTLRQAVANVSLDHDIDNFQPHIIHAEHEEFPIVMVNRPPHGLPGHNDIRVPQNAAWMAAFRYAKNKVFIQTPTLNSSPVVKMCIDAAKRGVKVILYLDLGFNDKGESIPFQGGTNQQVVIKMYKALKKFNKQGNLIVYWYTGKDQIRPINAVLKSRNCHVKFMAVDDQVGIQGNGNQDTQSWFHSQEINVMIDSEKIVKEWMSVLISNQNTELYGRVDQDGTWRDSDGHTVDYYDKQIKSSKRKHVEPMKEVNRTISFEELEGSNQKIIREQLNETSSSASEPSPVLTHEANSLHEGFHTSERPTVTINQAQTKLSTTASNQL